MRHFQFVIIGAGFAGAATAYHLTRRGLTDIVVLEQESIPGFHSSGRNAAMEILRDAGFELGLAACAVIDKLKLDGAKVPIGCVGSVFNAGELLTKPMLDKVRECAPKAFLTKPAMAPSHAAALMAYHRETR